MTAPSSTDPKSSKLKYVLILFFIPIVFLIPMQAFLLSPTDLLTYFNSLQLNLTRLIGLTLIIICILIFYLNSKPRTIYLLDFACYKPPNRFRVPFSTAVEHGHILLSSQPESLDFQVRMFERSGLGDETCLPNKLRYIPPENYLIDSDEEAQSIIFSAIDSLLEKTCLNPKDIDILIVNCSLFNPTPSLSALVVNKYKMRSNIKSFNLSGMGCSAGLISIDLARHLLQVHPEANAIVVSTEIITPNIYMGKDRSMLLPNVLFRMGGAAILLTNKSSLRTQAKYSLMHVIRSHKGSSDDSYRCVYQEEDAEGYVGVALNIKLMEIAGAALKANIATLGPLVLPVSEKLRFAMSLMGRKVFKLKRKMYIPDFKKAFEHFCIHAGGRAVIDELQKSLRLSDTHVEASRMTLHRFGNTSSSSLWYEMSYLEAKGMTKKGDRIWQIAFGSGFKCNSSVWKCNRNIKTPFDEPWAECIDRYPVHIPRVVKL